MAEVNLDIEEKDDDELDEELSSDGFSHGWSNPPTLTDLKKDYEDAKSDHDAKVTRIEDWLDQLNITGKAKPPKKDNRSSVQPQLIRKQAEWRYSSLSEPFLSTEDLFDAAPVTYEDKLAATQNGLVLNNQFNTKIDKVKFIGDYVRATTDEGTGIVRTGWDFEEKEVEVEVPDFRFVPSIDPALIQQHAQLHQLMQQNPDEFRKSVPPEMQRAHKLSMESGQAIQPIPDGSHIEMQMQTVKNEPTVEVCNFRDVIIDPTCLGYLDRAGFIIFRFETSLSELEKDGSKYSNLDKINTENNTILGEPDHYMDDQETSFNFSDKPRKKFIAYEYWGFWDVNGTGVAEPFVATWVGDTLIRLEENPFPDKALPFVTVQYLPVRRSIYGEPDGALLEDNQAIVGAVTRGMIDTMGRSANGQMGVRKDALDLTNKRKFDRGQDYEFNAAVDPQQAFHMHTYAEIPQSAGLMLQLQNQEAESLTGVKAFSSGISGNALGDTATGVRSALDATAKRELDILRRLADGIKQIGRKIVAMNAVFLDEEEVVRITNEEFVPVRRDDLAGNIDLSLSISTPESDNEKAQELAFMLQTTAQSMGPEFAQLILSEIASLRKMPVLAKAIKDYQPTPDPVAQQIQQLEVAKLEAEIAKIQSETVENQSDANLNNAKAGTEGAKASQISSDTDIANLDFVEQESGTKHARDVDKITSQAKAQTQTKIVEGAIKKDIEKEKSKSKE